MPAKAPILYHSQSRLLRELGQRLREARLRRRSHAWRLAPAYDMNPSVKKDAHVLALDDSSTVSDLDTVMGTAEFYRVRDEEAQADLARLRKVLSTWEHKAKQLGLSDEDRLELEDCFQF